MKIFQNFRLLEAGAPLPSTTENEVGWNQHKVFTDNSVLCAATMEKICCCSMRNICNIFAVLAMMGSISQVYKDGREIAYHVATDQEERTSFSLSLISGSGVENFHVETRNITEIENANVRTFFKINFSFAFIDVILNLGMIGANVCLLYGVHNMVDKFLLPLIWFLPCDLVVRSFFMLILITFFGITSPLSITVATLLSFVIIYDIIFWLCVYSYREQLLANSENSDYVSKV